jgi:hypothetical protein
MKLLNILIYFPKNAGGAPCCQHSLSKVDPGRVFLPPGRLLHGGTTYYFTSISYNFTSHLIFEKCSLLNNMKLNEQMCFLLHFHF